MARMLAQGTTRLTWLPTIALSTLVPTTAELNGGSALTSLGDYTAMDDFQLGAVDDDVNDEPYITSAVPAPAPSRSNYVAGITVYRGQSAANSGEKAWTLHSIRGTTGFLVIRIGTPGTTAWAVADVVSVYSVTSGDGQALTPDGANHKFRWPFFVQDVNERATITI